MSGERPVLLVVDDERGILEVIGRFAEHAGFDAVTCSTGRQALERLNHRRFDLALVDLRMPDVGGLEVLRAIHEADPSCRVVLMTGYASIETAVEAVKLGAMDYFSKPLDFPRLQQLLGAVRDEIAQRRSVAQMEVALARRLEFCGMVGRCAAMQHLFDLIRRLAPHLRTALIVGETGTGKELVARALHQLGPRRERRFVAVNCSAVVDTLFESELFGHLRGAFTGATENKPGLFEVADGGTLSLDEVGELPGTAQAKLLRVLEQGEVCRVGELEGRRVDVQVLSATNRDLRVEVSAARFRSDLFYRLNSVVLALPPLRDRREDIPYLTAAFLQEFAGRLGKRVAGITSSAERRLLTAPWDGNVRELRNVLERACILTDREFVSERELAGSMEEVAFGPSSPVRVASDADVPDADPELLSTVERDHILRALRKANGNKKAAASLLGVSRRALYRRLERLNLGDTITRRREPVQV
jgi:two-component system response regulator HydG